MLLYHTLFYILSWRVKEEPRFICFIKACSMKREENQVKNYVSKNILQSGMKETNEVMGYVMRVPTMG